MSEPQEQMHVKHAEGGCEILYGFTHTAVAVSKTLLVGVG